MEPAGLGIPDSRRDWVQSYTLCRWGVKPLALPCANAVNRVALRALRGEAQGSEALVKTTADFLDDARVKLGLASDGQLARYMGMKPQQLTPWRQKREAFGDETSLKFARVLQIEPDYIIACMAVQRARTPETRRVWTRIAAKVAAAVLVGLTLAGFDISSFSTQSARAGQAPSPALPEYTYAPIRRRRKFTPFPGRYGVALAFSRLARVLGLTLALAASAYAGDWTSQDSARQAGTIVASALDWSQTLDAVKHPCGPYAVCTGTYQESGLAKWFIGGHPSVGQVNNYFAAGIALNTAAAIALPASWRPAFQYGSIGFDLVYVIRNRSVNIGFSF